MQAHSRHPYYKLHFVLFAFLTFQRDLACENQNITRGFGHAMQLSNANNAVYCKCLFMASLNSTGHSPDASYY